jgi:hypothetical protein
MSARDHLNQQQFGKPEEGGSEVYNNVPELRGISRRKSTYEEGGGLGLAREDDAKLKAFRAQQAQK